MINELERVALAVDRPAEGLRAGDIGTVVMVYDEGRGYEVEFVALTGETVAVVTLPASAVRKFRQREIANARAVA